VRRITAIAVAFLVVTAAGCGDLLEGVGDVSRRVVHGDGQAASATTTTPAEGPALRLTSVSDVRWANDGIGVVTRTLPRDELLAAVWRRGDGISPFVQASRREITDALPGIEFPRLVPASVTHVSSQLVFDAQSALLDVATAAAFGMWVGEPYALPRTEGQLVVLRVGMRTAADIDTGEYLSFQVTDGRELVWTSGDHVYQLFCRTGVGEGACLAIAESMAPLATISD
jgi:hypothetical protein